MNEFMSVADEGDKFFVSGAYGIQRHEGQTFAATQYKYSLARTGGVISMGRLVFPLTTVPLSMASTESLQCLLRE